MNGFEQMRNATSRNELIEKMQQKNWHRNGMTAFYQVVRASAYYLKLEIGCTFKEGDQFFWKVTNIETGTIIGHGTTQLIDQAVMQTTHTIIAFKAQNDWKLTTALRWFRRLFRSRSHEAMLLNRIELDRIFSSMPNFVRPSDSPARLMPRQAAPKPKVEVPEDFDKWGAALSQRGQKTRINFNIWRSICDDAVTRYERMTETLRKQGTVLETVDLDVSRLSESTVDFVKPDRVTAGHDIAKVIELSLPQIVENPDWNELRESLVHLQGTFDGSIEIVQSDYLSDKPHSWHQPEVKAPRFARTNFVSTDQDDLSKEADNLWAIRAYSEDQAYHIVAAELEVAIKAFLDEIDRAHDGEEIPEPPIPEFLKDKDYKRFKSKYREEIKEAVEYRPEHRNHAFDAKLKKLWNSELVAQLMYEDHSIIFDIAQWGVSDTPTRDAYGELQREYLKTYYPHLKDVFYQFWHDQDRHRF